MQLRFVIYNALLITALTINISRAITNGIYTINDGIILLLNMHEINRLYLWSLLTYGHWNQW
jgi:hypothetical protein